VAEPTAPARILHLIDTGGPGGAETVFRDLVTHLPEERWESVAVVPWADDWLEGALRDAGLEPRVLTSTSSFDLRYLRSLAALVKEVRPDLIQTHLLTTAVYASAVSRLSGHPVVSTFHGQVDVSPDLRFRELKFRILDRPRNRYVFVSDALRAWFGDTTPLRGDRTRTVHNGVAFDVRSTNRANGARRAWRARLEVGGNDLLVGAVGNLRPSKDYETLLRAASRVGSEHPGRVVFAVAGEGQGELRARLEALRDELALGDCVRFLGFVDDVAGFLEALDIYVLTSSSEGFSLSTVEAMARGLPVVATACGGPEEIVEHGRTGRLVPVERPEEVARSLLDLASDAELRRRLGAAGRDSVTHRFSINAMVAGYEAVYRDVLTQPRGQGT